MTPDDEFPTRYPNYNVLDKESSPDWDAPTRQLVQNRLAQVPPIRFFTEAEVRTLGAIAERILPQPDRSTSARIPIVPWIDAKLFDDRRDGYRYEDLPPQQESWRLALAGFEQTANTLFGRAFTELSAEQQDQILERVEDGNPPGEAWQHLSATRFFRAILCLSIVKAYYAHPTAWSEIGYSGPSSPRGHVRIWIGGVDPWEAHESPSRWGTV
jgi:hypothetical protein